MKPAPENFDGLVKLLALKKEEQPPVAFFDDFSNHVINRLKTIEDGAPPTRMERWFGGFDSKPILAGAFSVAMCGLLLGGLSLAQLAREKAPEVALVNDWTRMAASRLPLSPEKWKLPAPTEYSQQQAASRLGPVIDAEPIAFPTNDFRLKTIPAGLFSSGN